MPFVELPTTARLHYVERNTTSSPTVIALHGMLGTAEEHLRHMMDWVAGQGYHVVGPTLRGYGESTPKPRDFPLRFYERDAEDVLALMDALEISQAHILGYSDGGEIALMLAGKYPDRVLSAVAWGAVGYFGKEMRAVAQRMLPATWLTQAEMESHQIPDANAFAHGWVRAVVHMIDSGGDVSRQYAPHITCPVLIMLGEEDTLNPKEYAEVFLEHVANGRLRMFPGGHPVHDEQRDGFYEVVGAFLRS